MDFSTSDIQNELTDLAAKFAQKELAPIIEADEESETFRPELIARLGELGLTGITVPEEYGGAGLGYLEYISMLEEIAAVSVTYGISVAVTGLTQIILATYGNEEQKKKLIEPLASGRAIGAFSLSEAGSGSDAAALKTTAVKEGDHYRVNGTKLWATQSDVAQTVLLMARTGGPGPKGISSFALQKGTPGFKMGKREKKMALSASHTMEIVLEDARIPANLLVGNEGDGFKIALSALDSGRITIAAIAVGLARSALDVARNHAKERTQFGKPIGEFQGVGFMLADMVTQISAARYLVRHAAWLRDQGKPYTLEAAQAKVFATDMAMMVTTNAVQVLGGSGFTKDFPVERYMREAKVLQIVEGTNQIQRLVISRALLD